MPAQQLPPVLLAVCIVWAAVQELAEAPSTLPAQQELPVLLIVCMVAAPVHEPAEAVVEVQEPAAAA